VGSRDSHRFEGDANRSSGDDLRPEVPVSSMRIRPIAHLLPAIHTFNQRISSANLWCADSLGAFSGLGMTATSNSPGRRLVSRLEVTALSGPLALMARGDALRLGKRPCSPCHRPGRSKGPSTASRRSLPRSVSMRSRAKSIAVPGPREVITLPSVTTASSTTVVDRSAVLLIAPG